MTLFDSERRYFIEESYIAQVITAITMAKDSAEHAQTEAMALAAGFPKWHELSIVAETCRLCVDGLDNALDRMQQFKPQE